MASQRVGSRHPGADPAEDRIGQASEMLKAMSNRHRLAVLCHLLEGEKSVGELERIVGLSQSALSQHLARLRRGKLVKTRRRAQTILYSLDGDNARRVMEALFGLFENDVQSPLALAHHGRARAVGG